MRRGNLMLPSGSDSGVFCVRTVSDEPISPFFSGKVVRIAGLEPARITPLPPQSSASANSAICARPPVLNQAFARHARSIRRQFDEPGPFEPLDGRVLTHGKMLPKAGAIR